MAKQVVGSTQIIAKAIVVTGGLVPKSRKTSTAFLGLFALFALFVVRYFRFAVVDGPSMLPTFHTGERLTVSNAYWLFGPIHDGDVVVFHDPITSGYVIKRVYKQSGEKVDLVNVPKFWSFTKGEYTVPKNSLYVLGDNRPKSSDSRSFGPIPMSNVIGKVLRFQL